MGDVIGTPVVIRDDERRKVTFRPFMRQLSIYAYGDTNNISADLSSEQALALTRQLAESLGMELVEKPASEGSLTCADCWIGYPMTQTECACGIDDKLRFRDTLCEYPANGKRRVEQSDAPEALRTSIDWREKWSEASKKAQRIIVAFADELGWNDEQLLDFLTKNDYDDTPPDAPPMSKPGGEGETGHIPDAAKKVLTCGECACRGKYASFWQGRTHCRVDGATTIDTDPCRFPDIAAAILAERARRFQ